MYTIRCGLILELLAYLRCVYDCTALSDVASSSTGSLYSRAEVSWLERREEITGVYREPSYNRWVKSSLVASYVATAFK